MIYEVIMRAAGEIFIIFLAKRLEYGLLRGGRRKFWWGGGEVGANSEKLGGGPEPQSLPRPHHPTRIFAYHLSGDHIPAFLQRK